MNRHIFRLLEISFLLFALAAILSNQFEVGVLMINLAVSVWIMSEIDIIAHKLSLIEDNMFDEERDLDG